MASTSRLTHPPFASSIDEARALIQQCAEPHKVGELVKEAVFRASQRLEMPVSRARDIWYGGARRIDAEEMDALRRGAEEAEFARALAAIDFLEKTALASSSGQTISTLRATLLAFQRNSLGELTSSASETVYRSKAPIGRSRNAPSEQPPEAVAENAGRVLMSGEQQVQHRDRGLPRVGPLPFRPWPRRARW